MNPAREQAELLRAAIVLAVADGVIAPSEQGLLKSLAKRLGVSRETLDRMVERALLDTAVHDEMFRAATADPELTLELLVAAARIDGEIHESEHRSLVQMAERLDVPMSEFEAIYERGVARADAIRGSKREV
jgi:tellurite resistance protein